MSVDHWNDEINLPVNLYPHDKTYFDKCLLWQYSNPKSENEYFTIVYPRGYCTNLALNPIKHIAPWDGFYKSFRKTYFLGDLITCFFKLKLRFTLNRSFFYCLNEFSDNYFHWFTEVLPKMIHVKKTEGGHAIFYIPFSLKDYQIQSLKICGINFYKTEDQARIFRKLTIVKNCTIYPGIYHPTLLSETKHILTKGRTFKSNKKRKVYVTRENATRRRLINEAEVIGVVKNYGFEIFDFDAIPFQEQVELMLETGVFISIHGAALTNMLFMPVKSVIIELLPIHFTNDKCYFILAGTLKHDYYYLNCEINGSNHIASDYTADVKALNALLNNIILNN